MNDNTDDVDPWAVYFEDANAISNAPGRARTVEILTLARDRYRARVAAGESAQSALDAERELAGKDVAALSQSARKTTAQLNLANNRAGRRAAKKRRR